MVPFPRYGRKRSFAGFKTSFTAFAVIISAFWRLYLLDRRYCCQNPRKKVHMPALKPVLRDQLFYFQHFGDYFESIEGTFIKMRIKTFIQQLLNQFYSIIFSSLEVILSILKVLLPKYGQKCLFAIFQTDLTAFPVLFLTLWRLFCVDRRYSCNDRFEKFNTPFKSLLRHSLFYFQHLEVILSRSKVPLPRYRPKCSFTSFETGFTAFTFLFLALCRLFCVN